MPTRWAKPKWVVEAVPDGVSGELEKLTCTRCGNHFFVEKKMWPGRASVYGGKNGATGDMYLSRPCPFCFCTSHTPERVIVRTYEEDLVAPRDSVEALCAFGLLRFKFEGPDGAYIYEPAYGVTLQRVRASIVWDRD